MPHCSSRFHEDGVIVIPSFVLIQVFLFHHKFILHVSLLLFFTDFYGFLVLKFCPSIIVIVIGVSNCLQHYCFAFLEGLFQECVSRVQELHRRFLYSFSYCCSGISSVDSQRLDVDSIELNHYKTWCLLCSLFIIFYILLSIKVKQYAFLNIFCKLVKDLFKTSFKVKRTTKDFRNQFTPLLVIKYWCIKSNKEYITQFLKSIIIH